MVSTLPAKLVSDQNGANESVFFAGLTATWFKANHKTNGNSSKLSSPSHFHQILLKMLINFQTNCLRGNSIIRILCSLQSQFIFLFKNCLDYIMALNRKKKIRRTIEVQWRIMANGALAQVWERWQQPPHLFFAFYFLSFSVSVLPLKRFRISLNLEFQV